MGWLLPRPMKNSWSSRSSGGMLLSMCSGRMFPPAAGMNWPVGNAMSNLTV